MNALLFMLNAFSVFLLFAFVENFSLVLFRNQAASLHLSRDSQPVSVVYFGTHYLFTLNSVIVIHLRESRVLPLVLSD